MLIPSMYIAIVIGFIWHLNKPEIHINKKLAKHVSLYLLLAIGLKGGMPLREATSLSPIIFGVGFSFCLTGVAFALLVKSGFPVLKASITAAFYGSVSAITFIAGVVLLKEKGVEFEGILSAVMAAMEVPPILMGIILPMVFIDAGVDRPKVSFRQIYTAVLNPSVLALFLGTGIGMISPLEPLIHGILWPFYVAVLVFLVCAGKKIATNIKGLGKMRIFLKVNLVMIVIGLLTGLLIGKFLGFGVGGIFLFGLLGASMSYIAVPASLEGVFPKEHETISTAISAALGITLTVNLTLLVPYLWLAEIVFAL